MVNSGRQRLLFARNQSAQLERGDISLVALAMSADPPHCNWRTPRPGWLNSAWVFDELADGERHVTVVKQSTSTVPSAFHTWCLVSGVDRESDC